MRITELKADIPPSQSAKAVTARRRERGAAGREVAGMGSLYEARGRRRRMPVFAESEKCPGRREGADPGQ
ncbi:hypothetical protein GCM10028787_03900 [Brachybacterium horti]